MVATEVRNLAQRSAAAAHEIKDLIASSSAQVQTGGAHADHAGKTIAAIVTQVSKVNSLVNAIAKASGQQANGFSQINAALSQIDTATQQNSALVEQTAAAAASLSEQANRLSNAVDVFQTPQAAAH